MTGMKLVFLDSPFDRGRFLETVEREPITFSAAVPPLLRRMLDHAHVARFGLSSVSSVGTGGAASSSGHLGRLTGAFPSARVKIGNGYGVTRRVGSRRPSSAPSWLGAGPRWVGLCPSWTVDPRRGRRRPVRLQRRGDLLARRHRHAGLLAPAGGDGSGHRRRRLVPQGRHRGARRGRTPLRRRSAGDLVIRGPENLYAVEIEDRLRGAPRVSWTPPSSARRMPTRERSRTGARRRSRLAGDR